MLNPWMLLGLAGLALPVIIHLIQRQRLKPQFLATLQFLDREDVANAFAPVPRDWIQLLLRLLLLALFVLLMARLAFGGRDPGPRTLVVLLDQSLSMQQKTAAGRPLFDVHKAAILDLVQGLGPRDRVSLRLVGDELTHQTGFTGDRAELGRALEGFTVTDGGALGLLPAVRAAVRELRSRHEVNTAVLVFSDQQTINFQSSLAGDTGAAAATAFAAELNGGHVKLLFVDAKRAPGDNLAVSDGRLLPSRVYLGASGKFVAQVHNYAAEAKTCRVTFAENGQSGESRDLPLAAGETAELDLVHRFESPVDVPCQVTIDDDVLPGDNRFSLPMRMRERTQVLLVAAAAPKSDEAGEELSYEGADLLAYALNPGEMLGQGSSTYINVRRVTPQVLERMSLPVYSLVIIYGNVELPEPSARDLKAYVASGGGLMLIPDETTAPARFNEMYQPLLGGFMLGQAKQCDPAQPLDQNEARLQTPLLQPLLRGEWGDLRELFVREYFTLAAPGPARTALLAGNGDPLAVLIPRERGRVYVQLFSCNLAAGSLPRSTVFVPMVQHLLGGLSRADRSLEGDTLRVGETLHVPVPEFRGLTGNVGVNGPVRRTFALSGAERDAIQVAGLPLAGAYELSHATKKSGRKHWLTVNPVAAESDLRTLSAAEQDRLFGSVNTRRLTYPELAGSFSRRHEVFSLIAVLVVAALAAEALVGAWLSRVKARLGRAPAGGAGP